jgi:hypothetical protein
MSGGWLILPVATSDRNGPMRDDSPARLFALLGARELNFELIWAAVGLVGAVLVGVMVIVWVDRWRKRSGTDAGAPSDELSHYRMLFEQGLLTAEEYERIRRRLEFSRPVSSAPASVPDAPAANSAPAVQNAPRPENQPGNQAGGP